jgi:UDP-N-acetylglucosamine 2-epimerase (hydrolysing)
VGNSSAGIREAPYYGLPTINVGSRQENRALNDDILNCSCNSVEIVDSIRAVYGRKYKSSNSFGQGNSDLLFLEVISSADFWEISKQKLFKDISYE